jgi:hypothetical protein
MSHWELTTYCGSYCGTCARYKDYSILRTAANLLAELINAHGFRYWLPREVSFNYNEFQKGLDFFRKEDSWLVCQSGCRGGDGEPPDCPRDCCIEHGVDLCFDCQEFPCKKMESDTIMIERAREYKRLGRKAWVQCLVKRAEQGYEHHTNKYYKITIEKSKKSSKQQFH